MKLEYKNVSELIKAFPTEKSCIDYLQKIHWNGNPISPFYPSSKVYKHGTNKFRCKHTGKRFNVRTGTMFESVKISFRKWFTAVYIYLENKMDVSVDRLAQDIKTTKESASLVLLNLDFAYKTHNLSITHRHVN